MVHASEGARDDLPRDGAQVPSRVVAPRILREAKSLPQPFRHMEATPFQVFATDDCWVLEIGAFGVTAVVRTTEAGVDALIGELLAAREQMRMERETRQAMADLISSFSMPDSEDEVPW